MPVDGVLLHVQLHLPVPGDQEGGESLSLNLFGCGLWGSLVEKGFVLGKEPLCGPGARFQKVVLWVELIQGCHEKPFLFLYGQLLPETLLPQRSGKVEKESVVVEMLGLAEKPLHDLQTSRDPAWKQLATLLLYHD